MKTGKLSPIVPISIALMIFIGIALFIRIYFPYDQVFSGGSIKFTGNDAYYHMRLIDNLLRNFPVFNEFDPYFVYPTGAWVVDTPFYDWLLAGVILVLTLGSPDQHMVDVVGVYFPAVLGALTVIPVFFIGKELFGRWAGLIAAALIAVLPGEFLGRSILGFTDHHVAETLITATAMMFLIMAVKNARSNGLTFNHIRQRDWAVSAKPVIYSVLGGVFLGIYLITWAGGLLFAFIITIYFIIQFIIDHLRHRATDDLCLVGVIALLVTLLFYLPISRSLFHMVFLVIALLTPLAMWGISWLMRKWEWKGWYYPLSLLGLAALGLAIFYTISPYFFGIMMNQFSIFTPGVVAQTTMEMQPLLSPRGQFTFIYALGNFSSSFFLAIIGFGILLYRMVKYGDAEADLFLVWGLVIFLAMLGQRRFAYYYVVNVAILSGYLSWQFLRLVANWSKGFIPAIKYVNMSLAIIIIFFTVFYPNFTATRAVASQAHFAPSDAWISSLSWLRANSPDPFGDTEAYYQIYESPPPGENYDYPESAYSVVTWWDYGYLVTRIAHRIPTANPGGLGRVPTANFLLAESEDPADTGESELNPGYVVVDSAMTSKKFYAIALYAGIDINQYYEVYHIQQENKLVPVTIYYPAYFQSMVVRLYNFDGKEVTPQQPVAISWEEKLTDEGQTLKQITAAQVFSSYEEAVTSMAEDKTGNFRLVGTNPFNSPVPLEALKDYELIHSAGEVVPPGGDETSPDVKIFKFTGDN